MKMQFSRLRIVCDCLFANMLANWSPVHSPPNMNTFHLHFSPLQRHWHTQTQINSKKRSQLTHSVPYFVCCTSFSSSNCFFIPLCLILHLSRISPLDSDVAVQTLDETHVLHVTVDGLVLVLFWTRTWTRLGAGRISIVCHGFFYWYNLLHPH